MFSYKLFDDMSRLFDSEFFSDEVRAMYPVPSFPPAKIVQRENKVSFKFALAGYKKDDIQISFGKDYLLLSTTEKFNKAKEAQKEDLPKVLVDNFKVPVFSYKYFIPSDKFNFEETEAKFEDGVLSIIIPAKAKEEVKPKLIEIK